MARINSLDLLDPVFKTRLVALLAAAAIKLPGLKAFETVRPPSRQTALYQQGRDPHGADYGRTVTKAKAYQSAHQYGLAADLVFFGPNGWTWSEPHKGDWHLLSHLAGDHGLEQLSFEQPHVQLQGFNWHALKPGPMDDASWTIWLQERA